MLSTDLVSADAVITSPFLIIHTCLSIDERKVQQKNIMLFWLHTHWCMHCSPYLRCSPFELVSCRTNHSVAPDKSQWCCQQRARRTMQRRSPIWKWIGRSPTTRRSSKHLLGLRLGQRPPVQQRCGLGRCLSALTRRTVWHVHIHKLCKFHWHVALPNNIPIFHQCCKSVSLTHTVA